MNNKVLGKNVILEADIDGWFPLFCAKTADLQANQQELEVTSVASSQDREFIPGFRDYTVNCTGVTTLDNTNGRISLLYLLQPGVIGNTFDWRMRFIDQDADTNTILFSGFLTSGNVSRALGGSFSQSAASIRVTGGLTFTTDVEPPVEPVCEVQDPLYLDMAEGETGVSDVLLEADGVTILEVCRTGIQHNEVTGTPSNLEFKFTGGAGNGNIDFDPANPGNPGGEVIYVLYKITT